MTDDLRKRLESELLQGSWSDLRDHAERQAVFLVASDLVLVDVGVAVAQDDVKRIEGWIQSSLFARPTVDQMIEWDRSPGREFRFLILAPYVLIQSLPN